MVEQVPHSYVVITSWIPGNILHYWVFPLQSTTPADSHNNKDNLKVYFV